MYLPRHWMAPFYMSAGTENDVLICSVTTSELLWFKMNLDCKLRGLNTGGKKHHVGRWSFEVWKCEWFLVNAYEKILWGGLRHNNNAVATRILCNRLLHSVERFSNQGQVWHFVFFVGDTDTSSTWPSLSRFILQKWKSWPTRPTLNSWILQLRTI